MTAAEAIAVFTDRIARPRLGRLAYIGWGGYPFADDGYEFVAHTGAQLFTDHPGQLNVWADVGQWPYHIIMRSDSERAVLSYVEGDVTVEIAPTDEAWRELIAYYLHAHPAP